MLKRLAQILEATAGAILTTLVAVFWGLCAYPIFSTEFSEPSALHFCIRWIGTLIVVALEFIYACLVLTSAGRKWLPLAPVIAIRQPTWPILLRPFISLFWLAHFVFLLCMIWLVNDTAQNASLKATLGWQALTFALQYCAFGFLLMTVTAIKKSAGLVSYLWDKRFWISLTISLLIPYFPLFLPVRRG